MRSPDPQNQQAGIFGERSAQDDHTNMSHAVPAGTRN